MADAIDAATLWSMLKKHPITMFTTMQGDRLVSRPMAGFVREDEGRIYFLTRFESEKTREVEDDAQVNLAYADPRGNTYVSVAGTARADQDRARIRDLWNKDAEAWLPDGPDAPDTGLITVTPDDAVIWDSTSSRIVHALKLVTAIATQTPPDTGRVSKVAL